MRTNEKSIFTYSVAYKAKLPVDGLPAMCPLSFGLARIAVRRARSTYGRKRACSVWDLKKLELLSGLIEQHYTSDRPVDFYSGKLGVSIKTLNRLCSFVLGQTVYQLVMDRRLSEARKLLGSGELIIKEIAYELGFKSPGRFGKFFKDMTGMCARAYRYHSLSGIGKAGPAG